MPLITTIKKMAERETEIIIVKNPDKLRIQIKSDVLTRKCHLMDIAVSSPDVQVNASSIIHIRIVHLNIWKTFVRVIGIFFSPAFTVYYAIPFKSNGRITYHILIENSSGYHFNEVLLINCTINKRQCQFAPQNTVNAFILRKRTVKDK